LHESVSLHHPTSKALPKRSLYNEHLTFLTSVSTLITNGYLHIRTCFLSSEAITLQFKPVLIMHTTKHFTMKILHCLFNIKWSTSPCINWLTCTWHITTWYCFQSEPNTTCKTYSKKRKYCLKQVRMRYHVLTLSTNGLEK
jgi:hypothetical protein